MAVAIATVFDLPEEIFARCTPLDAGPSTGVQLTLERLEALEIADRRTDADASGLTCTSCGLGRAQEPAFPSVESQREHFRGDWHRFNLKRRLASLPACSEADFEALVAQRDGAEVGSLSGSESSDDEDHNGGGEGKAPDRADGGPSAITSGARGPYTCFWDPGEEETLGVWRSIVGGARDAAPSEEAAWSTLRTLRTKGATWAVIMLRGGHFAASVLRLVPARIADKRIADKFDVVGNTSAHRYVTRAKAGGKQSTQDATGKFAKSAGSRLRRYNEAALAEDVKSALTSWTALLGQCDLIHVQAPGSNWKDLMTAAPAVLSPSDPRLRTVPFTTRRPTFSENKRVARILISVYRMPATGQPSQPSVEAPGGEAVRGKQSEAGPGSQPGAPRPGVSAEVISAADQGPAEPEAPKGLSKKQKAKARAARSKAAAKEQAAMGGESQEEEPAPKSSEPVADEGDVLSRAAALAAATASAARKGAATPARSGRPATQARRADGGKKGGKVSAEDIAARRVRLAAAAEARMAALASASAAQKLW
ncbi:hypothetical protein APUTEX25_002883 [Auxenochlorella protothecoides]|uniref:VLRF1 domain-containing protein n=1 Tax=Auxenochlorella protothecoides TaxID=3075 RepID=A0A3M7L3V7_AUXPR|nr:hypothetical protein APUTEX25_002883 [Auxenochlorella protothecoides]|eukprot:RMZ56794.1 hypothetical protein APUTEX25_002883 [Auxenochlorella protothecoides]